MSGLCVGAQFVCVCFLSPSALERSLAGVAYQGLITGLLKELRSGGRRQPVATLVIPPVGSFKDSRPETRF
ncbi:hypothetical protein ATANTOWER_030019 [Ataeniobius toweri]|uniref:Secreted protein n=1 Tax=Ataeniobius toweri TaxID=208326 RepID=A0ABU7AL46_9TELE|nr:hypothetical protein [Ataeniobius toweri]